MSRNMAKVRQANLYSRARKRGFTPRVGLDLRGVNFKNSLADYNNSKEELFFQGNPEG